MMKKIISLIQMDIATGDVEKNLKTAAKLIEKAARNKPDYIVLPEMWSTGFSYQNLSVLAKEHYTETVNFMSHFAVDLSAYVIGGSIPLASDGKIFNSCHIISPNGKVEGIYNKVHAFSLFGEDKHFAGGTNTDVISTPHAKIGASICYDIRFPELQRKFALNGAEILFIPAQFPAAREKHWQVLLQARAIENQLFTAGCNRIGRDNKAEYNGGSVIFDPFGEIVEKGSDKEEVVTGQIDLSLVASARAHITVFKDRRPEIYK